MTLTNLKYNAHWLLLISVNVIGIILWALQLANSSITLYQVYPILGILAWSTMWTQYAKGAILKTAPQSKLFSRITESLVFVLILLHPVIFFGQRYQDTGMLPPESYISHVGTTYVWAIIIAFIALGSFLLYDIVKPIRSMLVRKRVWPYVSILQAIAMILIFIHALAVGSSSNNIYFAIWWWLLGAALLPMLYSQIQKDFRA